MSTQKLKKNYKKLSAISVAILLVLSFIKIAKPDFYQKYFADSQPKEQKVIKENINSNFPLCSGKQECVTRVIGVVDGDTIDISTGERVRYIGVDTPETKHPIKKVECFGKEASEKNKELVSDKEVRLEKDVSDKDRYGRLLRHVYVNDLFINDYLARNGFAHAATFPPDVKYSQQFVAAEKEARENFRGLWAPSVCP
jgi:micrococcal nuclease